jgi:4-hydroxy-3-methylbut-2-enyl diphosphate reductase
MKVTVAKTAGFCMGVRRAVEMVLDTANRASGPVYTFGPLIHNPQVMDILAEKGVKVLDHVPERGEGTVVIRAHGVTPQIEQELVRAGFQVSNATCPRVIKVQSLLQNFVAKGYFAVIVGDADHPEVVGLLGHTQGRGAVVAAPEQVDFLPDADKVLVVAQTTQDAQTFEGICEKVRQRFGQVEVFNTICDSTSRRQKEAAHLAATVDAMVVVGGKNSGNTKRLAQIAERAGVPTFHVETDAELDKTAFEGLDHIGITAGASTPTWITRRVRLALENQGLGNNKGRTSLFPVMRALLLTNAYVALGAGCLCAASLALLGLSFQVAPLVMACAYVLSIHTFNNFIGKNAIRYNDPDRAAFYEKYRRPLLAVAGLSLLASLGAGLFLGLWSFFALLFLTLAGLLYNVRLVPGTLPVAVRYPMIRAIPASKTFSVALAWGLVAAFVPLLSEPVSWLEPGWLVVLLWAGSMAFVRAAFFDVLDVQIDRIAGQETVATWLGPDKTRRLVRAVLAAQAGLLAGAWLLGWVTWLGLLLLLCSAFLAGVLAVHEKGRFHPGYRLEFAVDSIFILAGGLAGLWYFLAVA